MPTGASGAWPKKHRDFYRLFGDTGSRAACKGVFGQAYDRTWITGMHEFPGTPGYNNALIRFSADPISVQEQDLKMNFESTVGVVSDTTGALLFYTNGCAVAGADGAIMPGGEGLNPGEIHDWVCGKTGYISPRGAMALPPQECRPCLWSSARPGCIFYGWKPPGGCFG